MRIGIVTFFSPYGGALQCFALQKILRDLGHEVLVINRKWGAFNEINKLSVISQLKVKLHRLIVGDPFKSFYSLNFSFTKPVLSEDFLYELGTTKYFDIIIVGSDQPWNPGCIKVMGYYFYLDWVSSDIKKFAYAVSYGKDYFAASEYDILKIKSILKTYCAISVREKSGVNISKDLFCIDAKLCLDPTLLLDATVYESLIVNKKKRDNYICVFFLDVTELKRKFLQEIAMLEGLPVVDNNPTLPESSINRFFFRKKSISEWLRNIRDAKYVITDSFHGTVFSIIFHKKFISLKNLKRGATRFESLLSSINLMSRLIDVDNMDSYLAHAILKEEIDYRQIDSILNKMKMESLSFLKEIR